jgi:hypothetical protein
MQRRHFKAIADALNAVRPATRPHDAAYYMWARTVARFTTCVRSRTPTLSATASLQRAAATIRSNT